MRDNLVGQKFNKLLVLEEDIPQFYGKIKVRKWKCICDCGSYRSVRGHHLKTSYVRSCGCDNFTLPHGNRKTTAKDTSINSLWNRHLQTASRKNREWSLTKEKFKELVFSNCHYCNSKPLQSYNVFKTKEGKYRKGIKEWADSGEIFYNGIDRKDNNLGYTEENSLSCCFICNRAKLTMSYDDFIFWIKDLVNKWHV